MKKNITGRALGTHYEKEYLLQQFESNLRIADTPLDISSDSMAILFIKSDLRLVVDLQTCVKAQQNRAYSQKVKLSNLQEMAKTIAYIQEHEYDTREILEDKFSSVKSLKEKNGTQPIPTIKQLKEKKNQLLSQKNNLQKQYDYYRDYKKELHTVCSNVDMILKNESALQAEHFLRHEIR